jgi:hypothetical protein
MPFKKDLSQWLQVPFNKKLTFAPEIQEPELEFINEEEDGNIKTIIDESIGVIWVSDFGFGVLKRKYLAFSDNNFGVWYDEETFHIGSKDNKVVVVGNDLIINNERYKGTREFWKLLTNPNKNKLHKDTYES